MKIHLLYISLITTLLMGCQKFLDVKPLGKVIPTTLEDYAFELNDAYNQYSSLLNKGYASYRSDEVTYRSNSGQTNMMNQYNWDDNNTAGKPVMIWRTPYAIIFYTNHLIENIDNIPHHNTAEKNQLKGEAHLLRAMMYFDLVNLFGDAYKKGGSNQSKSIPIINAIDLESAKVRNTVEEVYAQIVQDLTTGTALINREQFAADSSFKFTTVAANALASRVYLYMQNWDKVIHHAQAVLAVKNHLSDLNQTQTLPNLYTDTEVIQTGNFIFNSSMLSYFYVSNDLLSLYHPEDDLRYNLYYKTNSAGTTVLKSGSNKYACNFRVAEQYLNLAEAYWYNNDIAQAKKYLLLLKENRYTPEGFTKEKNSIQAMSNGSLLTEIYQERARELAFEGHRWFDLKRTTQPVITHKGKINGKDTTFTLNQNDARYTIKIPLEAIKQNPKLAD